MYFAVLKKRWITLVGCLLIGVITAVGVGFGVNALSVSSKASRKLPIYRVNTNEKKIAISFDCAWGVDYTDQLLSTMKNENVKCTFFAVEFWVEKHPDYVKKIDEHGHEWGTHSATHPYMSKLDKQAVIKELSSSRQAIENITSKKVEVFRPPYGDYNDNLIQTATELGLFTIQWDVDSLDWKNLSASEIEKRVVSRVKNGSIVLFHNQGLHTAEALPNIIKSLKEKGFEFVTVGELIYRDNFTVLPDGSQQLKN
ncbi:MAG: polysaccharide deacetylase family protein [Clostridia bacterium]|nr:polysaccharide deacetylase family protein [Clostridia bacterium]